VSCQERWTLFVLVWPALTKEGGYPCVSSRSAPVPPAAVEPLLRVLILGDRWLLCHTIEQFLHERGVAAVAGDLGIALAAPQGLVVLFQTERWNGPAMATLRRLVERGVTVFVICPAALQPASYLAILERGARDAASEEELALRALALKVQRWVQQPATRLAIGAVVFDLIEECLRADGRRLGLTQQEARLLRTLYVSSISGGGLFAKELALRLGTSEGVVRNLVQQLRLKLEEFGQASLLSQDPTRGYFLLLDQPE
jgi:DNA-binding response OmpR family regulator